MNRSKRGFTLLELLIAATIIGILAVLSTVAFRSSAGETRVAGAKSKLEMLAMAVQRYKMDPKACSIITSNSSLTVSNLVSCGYLENLNFSGDSYFSFYICASGSGCPNASYLACMTGYNSKLPSRYLSGYSYCLDEAGRAVETMGSN